MKKTRNIIWGVVLLLVGVVIALNALDVTDVSLWFDGWWTLFIIIPCLIGLFTEKDKIGNIIGLCIGGVLLLCAQDILDFSLIWKLILPAIIIAIALTLIFKGVRSDKTEHVNQKSDVPSGFAAFSGNDMNFSGKTFEGAELNAIFGGIECDLRDAIIEEDCVINLSAVFGGIDILLPENVKVNVDSTSIFGGISDERKSKTDSGVTVHIKGLCLFGGVDIK